MQFDTEHEVFYWEDENGQRYTHHPITHEVISWAEFLRLNGTNNEAQECAYMDFLDDFLDR